MKKKLFNTLLLILIPLSSPLYAEDIKNKDIDLYHVKLIMVSHNSSNYTDFNSNFINDHYIEDNFININKNNCIINDEKICIKYDFDYKVETFNDFKIALESSKDIEIISHLEWVQNLKSDYKIKIKNGYDYSDDLINGDIEVNNIAILSNGRITKYEGSLSITKNKFFNVIVTMLERKIMEQPGLFSANLLVSKKYNIAQKIQLNKLTYIDREYYGIIIKIVKIID
jgi:hypothetical protein